MEEIPPAWHRNCREWIGWSVGWNERLPTEWPRIEGCVMRTAKVLRRPATAAILYLLLCLAQAASAENPVQFNDAGLKTAIEAALHRMNPAPSDMLTLKELDAIQLGIGDLEGLQYATNLTSLWLIGNRISNLTPLSGLTHLTELGLDENQISDLRPLKGLTHLTALWLDRNQAQDLSPLTQLTDLMDLTLSNNLVSDLTPLGGLTHLRTLWLDGNQIHTISPLVGLTELRQLDLRDNPLYEQACTVHIPQILADNPGIDLRYHPCIDQCILTISSGDGGSVKDPGEGSFQHQPGSVVRIVAEADSGWEFTGWTGTAVDGARVDNPALARTTVKADEDYTLQANFRPLEVGTLQRLVIDCDADGSIVTPGEGTFWYAYGTLVTVVAKPAEDHHLRNWSGTAVTAGKVADAAAASTTVLVDDDYTLDASFEADPGPGQHMLTVTWGEGGSVTTEVVSGTFSQTLMGAGTFLFDDGAAVTVTVSVKPGWRFAGWTGTVASAETTVTFTLTSDLRLVANLVRPPRTLTVACGEGGTVTQPGVGSFSYQPGTLVQVEAVPKLGYVFAGWTGTLVDKLEIPNPSRNRITVVVTEDSTLCANFEAIFRFRESWETVLPATYAPAKAVFIHADEGVWSLEDAVSDSASCGLTPQRAAIVELDNSRALLLTSYDSTSACSDIVSVSLTEAGLVNPGFALTVDANTVLKFYETGGLDGPGLHDPSTDCAVPPCFDNVSLLLSDNRGNVLAYVLQRYPEAHANIPNTRFGDTYREVLLDPSAIYYQRRLLSDLQTIPAFDARDAQIRSIEFRVDEHGSAVIDEVSIEPGIIEDKTPVYRFWSPTLERHFFTTGAGEKQNLIDLYPDTWTFEGIAYFAPPGDRRPGTAPVYRFWSPVLSSHFYTISETERDTLFRDFAGVWMLDGVAFCAYAEGHQPADAKAVYRFWSGALGCHFYTISETERDNLVANFPHIWTLEGIAWYAYPPRWDSGGALTVVRDSRK